MNPLYNKNAAVSALVVLRQEQVETSEGVLDLGAMFDKGLTPASYQVVQAPEGGWRLVRAGSTALSRTAEEIVVAFQGIISQKDLPPFEEKIVKGSKQIKYLRQSLTLTAFGNAMYDKLIENIATVHGIFGRAVGPMKLQPCSISSSIDDDLVIEMGNRYFTPKKDAGSNTQSVDFTKDIDPHDYLAIAAGNDYVHTPENSVLYYRRLQVNDNGHFDYVYTPPVSFQVGDVVEAQVSFSMYPLREGKFKTALVLRSVLLLDDTHTDSATILQTSAAFKKKEVRPMVLKRRVGYGNSDEQLASTRAKFQRMEIEGDSTKNLD